MQVFPIASAGVKPLWVLLPVLLIMIGVLAMVALSAIGSRGARFELTAEGLTLRGDFYGRTLRFDQLRLTDARRVDVSSTSELRPRLRTLGTGLPGYSAGWFRLANGESALLYLTDRSKAVYVPTTLGYSLLLSPDAPDRFLEALRSRVR